MSLCIHDRHRDCPFCKLMGGHVERDVVGRPKSAIGDQEGRTMGDCRNQGMALSERACGYCHEGPCPLEKALNHGW